MRFAVETWAPDYGAPVDEVAQAGTADSVDVDAEMAGTTWAPRRPPCSAEPAIRFVDGVRRIEARVWVPPDGPSHQGICASFGAGVMRCDGTARLQRVEVRRRVFCPASGAGPIATVHGTFPHVPVAADGPDDLSIALQGAMADLENEVSEADGAEGADGGLLVVDGPLRQRHHLPGAVGYVKTHHRAYLPEALHEVVAHLAPGERTPVFLVGGRFPRWSWYLRLPGPVEHRWAGVVRCEASHDLSVEAAVRLADRVTATLPRYASSPQKDARAPQNLHPIAGLERELRRRLGDPTVWHRALRRAAAAA